MSKKEDLIKENDDSGLESKLEDISEENLEVDKDSNVNSVKSNTCIDEALKNITTANTLKDQISKVPLSFEQKNYFDTQIVPLLTTAESLSKISYNISTSSLSLSNIRLSKNSKIEDAIKLVYDVNKTTKEVYEALKGRIDFLIDIGYR